MFENHPFVSKKMLAVIMAAAVLLFVTGACMSISSGELSDILRSVADAIGTSEEDEQEQQAGEEDQAGEGEETAANEQGEQAESASSEDGNKQVGPPLPLELAVQYAVSQPLEKGTAACIAPAIAQAAVEGQVAVLQSVPPAISQPSTASDAVPGGGVAVSGEVSGFTTTQDSCSQYQNKIVFSRLDTSQPNAHSELYLVDPDGSNLYASRSARIMPAMPPCGTTRTPPGARTAAASPSPGIPLRAAAPTLTFIPSSRTAPLSCD